MRRKRSWAVAAGLCAVLVLGGCGGDEGASGIDISGGDDLCPFFTDGELEELNLSEASETPSDSRALREEVTVLDECGYISQVLGDAPLTSVRVWLAEGEVSEHERPLPETSWEESELDGIASERGTVFGEESSVCDLLIPGHQASDGTPATTVQLQVWLPVGTSAGMRNEDVCADTHEAAPLLAEKFSS